MRTDKVEASTELGRLTDAQLTELAQGLDPSALVGLVVQAREQEQAAAEAAKRAAHALNYLIMQAIGRADVNNSEIMRRTGIPERDFYRRPKRL